MIELYGIGPSRWVKCYWMLKELGKDFKECPVKIREGEHLTPKMLAMNPFGKLPVLKDGDVTVYESNAIINYLGEKHPDGGLVPKAGTNERAQYDQWMSFCVSDLEQPLWRITKHTFLLPEAKRIPQDVALAREDYAKLATTLDQVLGAKKFVVGNRFTAADITLAYTLNWAKGQEQLAPYKNCARYHAEHTARPSFPKHLFAS